MIETQPAEMRDQGSSDQSVKTLLTLLDDRLDQALQRIESAVTDQVVEKIGFTAEALGLIKLLAVKSNQSRDEVIDQALTLYGLVLDAVEQGNKLAILSPEDEIVRDINGIGAPRSPNEVDAAWGSI